ncbi:MAG TPA: PqqD family protein [Verrucomicrobiae bacterium]|nr:PqqD family protein [Verrucomicrobiae bacterium]
MVTFSNRVVVPAHVLVRHLDNESVLLNLETEKYFGLDATGTRMWEISTRSPSIENAYSRLYEEFDVEPALLRTHLADLLAQLVDNGLLQVVPADVESVPAV